MIRRPGLGATPFSGGRCHFLLWAPLARSVEVHIVSPDERLAPLKAEPQGYFHGTLENVPPGSRYFYRLDGAVESPDPASRFQPEGIRGPSAVVDGGFPWEDAGWFGIPQDRYIIYELHVGGFTEEGTFDALIPELPYFKELGITALELMPVAQFSGKRNWGYDGVFPYAVQNSYGGPDGLRRLVNACHRAGLAVLLDTIYNHIGCEGNCLVGFGPYFSERYQTSWGSAPNFDGPESDHVRRYFLENALHWVTDYHLDGLRLDAADTIVDVSAEPFIRQLAEAVHDRGRELNRRIYLFAESALNDPRFVRSPALGGLDLDAQWNDEFHHIVHVLTTGERTGYYRDYEGIGELAQAFRDGFVHTGEYSHYRRHRFGASSKDIPAFRFVVFSQNHDQVGNHDGSLRSSKLVSFPALKLIAATYLLSPFIPLIFMGEEYAEKAPFYFFTDHLDPALAKSVSEGRTEWGKILSWEKQIPDPQAEATFLDSRPDFSLREKGEHAVIFNFYKELIRLRKEVPALANLNKARMEVLSYQNTRVLFVRRWTDEDEAVAVYNFSPGEVRLPLPFPAGDWQKTLDSEDERWQGNTNLHPARLDSNGEATLALPPHSFVLYTRLSPVLLG